MMRVVKFNPLLMIILCSFLANPTILLAGSPTAEPKEKGAVLSQSGKLQKADAMISIDGKKALRGSILVKLKHPEHQRANGLAQAMERSNLKVGRKFELVPGLQRLELNPGTTSRTQDENSLLAAIKELQQTGMFEYVEPDWIVHTLQVPTDSAYTGGTLWGLHNTGQSGGTAGIDINARLAWDITTGSPSVVVGVVDTGIRYTHQDLAANMWTNPREIPGNGIDDDGNGFIDDIHGINAITGSGDPFDDNNHGTHCAGTIAASAFGGGPHVGVAYDVKLMALKFLDADGSGATSDAITCIEYALSMGVDVLSNSWGGGGFSQAVLDAIQAANAQGVLFVAAAGNESSNNDLIDNYPSNYEVDNIIAVAAIDRTGALAGFSNYGIRTVDIAAPGVEIYSTTAGSDNSYASFQGTSMATPHVAGAAALLVSQFPGIGITELRNRLINTASPLASLNGKVASSGMLDAHAALTAAADGTLELRAYSNGNLEANAVVPIYVSVNDLTPVTGATVSASFSGGTPVPFVDNGISPDLQANDGVYSASLLVPSAQPTVNLNVQASAPGKTPASESFSFDVLSRPDNDLFADRMVLAAGSTQTTGTNVFATTEVNEPRNPSASGGRSVWWSWTAGSGGEVTISTSGSDFDTTLAVYRGNDLAGLVLMGSNDDANGLQSAVTFTANSGSTYQIQVDGYGSNQGNIQLNYPTPGGESGQIPVILTQPTGRSVLVGDPFTLSVVAAGTEPLFYEWRRDGGSIPGSNAPSYSVAAALQEDQGNYSVRISNEFGSITSNNAFVSVNPIGLVPDNDNFANAALLSGSRGTVGGSTIRATGEISEPNHADASTPLTSVWYRWTAPANGTLTVDTSGSDFDTTLAAYTGSSIESLVLIAANDDSSGLQSAVNFVVTTGTTYRFAVDGFSSSEGAVSLNHLFEPDAISVPNDPFANRIELSGSQTATGTNIGATGENAEPDHANASSPVASAWWSWTAPTSGQLMVNTLGSDFDTTLAVYSGSSLDALTAIASNDDFSGLQSQVTINVVEGISYAIAVDGYATAEGNISLTVDFTPDQPPVPEGLHALYLADDSTGDHPARVALQNLGHTITVVDVNAHTFPPDLSPFDLMVIELYNYSVDSAEQQAIADFVASGKPAVLNYWDLNNAPSLQAAFGLVVSQSITAPEALHLWQAADPVLFGLPGLLAPIGDNGGSDNGDKLQPLNDARALAGYTLSPTDGEAAIISANEGRTIVNGFSTVDFDAGSMITLLENEILFVTTAGRVSFFRVAWSGTALGNTAEAEAIIGIDLSTWNNPSSGSERRSISGSGIVSILLSVSGASSGNGRFLTSDFSDYAYDTKGSVLDFRTELLGQATSGGGWGTSYDGNTGDFNLVNATASAPTRTNFFELSTNGGNGDPMVLDSFVPLSENLPPIADAGNDVTVVDSDFDNLETVTLDGSSSHSPDGTIISWDWSWNDGNASGETANATFPLGYTLVTLTVTDDQGATAADTFLVSVEAAPNLTGDNGDTWMFGSGNEMNLWDATLVNGGFSGSDAFDGASEIQINGINYSGAVVAQSLRTRTGETQRLQGVDVTVGFEVPGSRPAIRTMVTLSNPSDSPLTIELGWLNNWGSDENTSLHFTSSGDSSYQPQDFYGITNDRSDPAMISGDPTNVSFWGDGTARLPNTIVDPFSPGALRITYDLTIAPGETQTFLFVHELSTSGMAGETAADEALSSGVLLAGLNPMFLSRLQNWTSGNIPRPILLIEDQGGFGTAADILAANGFHVTVINDEFANGYATLKDGDYLSQFGFIVYGERGDGSGAPLPADVRTSLESYIQNGGHLLVTGYDTLGSPTDPELATLVRALSPADFVSNNPTWVVSSMDHPILNGPFADLRGITFSALGYDDDSLTPDTAAGAIELVSTGSPRVTGKLIFTDLPGNGGSVGYWNGGNAGSTNAQPDFSDGGDPQAIFLNYASFATSDRESTGTAPEITSPVVAYAATGSPFSYQITADNTPISFGASAMPSGLSINTTTGVISGSVEVPGIYSIHLAASNAAGTGRAVLRLEIVQPVSYADWPLLATLPNDRRSIYDRNGPLSIQNLMAFAMGIDPMHPPATAMPMIVEHDSNNYTVTLRYRRDKFTVGTTLTPMISTHLDSWTPATVIHSTVIQDDGHAEVIDVRIATTRQDRTFLRLLAQ
jgi:subtilisin family serine protease